MVIGEGPGWNENRVGVPFVGKAGQELDFTYLQLAGIDRSKVFVTNCVQCRCERNGVDVKPSVALRDACADNHLVDEINSVDPEVIILCGATACEWFDPKIDLELEHGFPRKADFSFWSGTVVPMYHPAAGLHETRFMTPMLEDWERLGLWLQGKWKVPDDDDVPWNRTYELLHGELNGLWHRLAIDTESDEGAPYSIQWSGAKGRGYMLFVDDERGLGKFRAWMASDQPEVICHNAPYDLDVLDRLGIQVHRFRDTMQELYHLGNLPQGLKAAVYRIFGHKMTSYDEVVTPHSKEVLEVWLCEALAHVSSEMRSTVAHPVGPDCPTCGKTHRKDVSMAKPHEAEAVLRRVLGKLGEDYDPWEQPKWDKGVEKPRLIGRDWLEEVEQVVGRMPRRSIVHAPLADQITYSVGDADWTLRLANWLDGERRRIVQEEWKVA